MVDTQIRITAFRRGEKVLVYRDGTGGVSYAMWLQTGLQLKYTVHEIETPHGLFHVGSDARTSGDRFIIEAFEPRPEGIVCHYHHPHEDALWMEHAKFLTHKKLPL